MQPQSGIPKLTGDLKRELTTQQDKQWHNWRTKWCLVTCGHGFGNHN